MIEIKNKIQKLNEEIKKLNQQLVSTPNNKTSVDQSSSKLQVAEPKPNTNSSQKKITDIIKISRDFKRPTTLDLIDLIMDDFIELHGDRRFSDDSAIVGGIGIINNIPLTIIGHQKGRDVKENIRRNFGMAHPEGYRKALRLMKEAEMFGRPVINFIDTAGAYPGIGAEERGQAEAIAFNLQEMSALKVPIISIITGEGGSGGALALGVADRVFLLSNSIYSVISPEGCAAILWKDSTKSAQAAEALKITSKELLELGLIDGIIPEPEHGAHRDYKQTAMNIKEKLVATLDELLAVNDVKTLLDNRYNKFRKYGSFEE
jgi:acetyl-CoA carboxylase carboxyl transferase subunit alpha